MTCSKCGLSYPDHHSQRHVYNGYVWLPPNTEET